MSHLRCIHAVLIMYVLCVGTAFSQGANDMAIRSISKISKLPSDLITPGSTLAISGVRFPNVSNAVVYFGAAVTTPEATNASENFLQVVVPAGATYDYITLVDTNRNLRARSPQLFLPSFSGESFTAIDFNSGDTPFGERGTASTLVAAAMAPPNHDVPLYDLVTCDLDSDGKLDVIAAQSDPGNPMNTPNSPSLPVFINRISDNARLQTLTESTHYLRKEINISAITVNVDCADLDNDGDMDIVATQAAAGSTPGTNFYYAINNISAGSPLPGDTDLPFTVQSRSLPAADNGNQRNIRRIKIRDVDNDGRPDLIVNNELDSAVFVYRNTTDDPSNIFSTDPVMLAATGATGQVLGLDVKDLNNDARADIIVASLSPSQVYVFQNESTQGNVSFAASQVIGRAISGSIRNIIAADATGDGNPDILLCTTNAREAVLMFVNTLTGEDISFNTREQVFALDEAPWGIDAGDVDGDGYVDLVVATPAANGPYLLMNDGAGDFQLLRSLNHRPSRNVRFADMNQNGKQDIIMASYDAMVTSTDAHYRKGRIWVMFNGHCIAPQLSPIPATVCNGVSLEVEATGTVGGATYGWQALPASGGTGQSFTTSTTNALDIGTGLNVGTYRIQVSVTQPNALCFVGQSQSEQFEKITGSALNPSTLTGGVMRDICEGDGWGITPTPPAGISPQSHNWTGPNGFTSTEASINFAAAMNMQAGTYEYYYTADVGGAECPSEATTQQIEIRGVPSVDITASEDYGCRTSFSITLSGTTLTGVSYEWNRSNAPILPAETSQTYTATTEGDYTVTISDGTCSRASNTLTLSAIDPPELSLNPTPVRCVDREITLDATATAHASAAAVGLNMLTYNWTLGDGITSADPAPITHTYTNARNYSVMLEVAYQGLTACRTSATTNIQAIEAPTLSLMLSPDKNMKCPTEEVTINAPNRGTIATGGTTEIVSYLWSTGATNNSITVRQPGTYTLTAMDDAQCEITTSVTIENIEDSGITIESRPSYPFRDDTLDMADVDEGEKINIILSDYEEIIRWSRIGSFKSNTPDEFKQRWPTLTLGLDTALREAPMLTAYYDEYALGPYIYKVDVRDNAECLSEAYLKLTLNPDPNPIGFAIFSPNNDGRNDRWRIYKADLNPDICNVKIYDRRGTLVFEKENIPADWEGWDGKTDGKDLSEDVYFYILDCNCSGNGCPIKDTGSVMLFRG